MALRWDVTKVENYEANFPSRMVIDEPIPMKDQDGNIVEYVGERKEREVWNGVTEALALAGMFHGIREITKDNVDEIYTRIRMFEISEGHTILMKRSITYDEIVKHIGMTVNVSDRSKSSFTWYISRILREIVGRALNKQKNRKLELVKSMETLK